MWHECRICHGSIFYVRTGECSRLYQKLWAQLYEICYRYKFWMIWSIWENLKYNLNYTERIWSAFLCIQTHVNISTYNYLLNESECFSLSWNEEFDYKSGDTWPSTWIWRIHMQNGITFKKSERRQWSRQWWRNGWETKHVRRREISRSNHNWEETQSSCKDINFKGTTK
jgi:hypothetical protein